MSTKQGKTKPRRAAFTVSVPRQQPGVWTSRDLCNEVRGVLRQRFGASVTVTPIREA